ncbi:MAG: hypothetical protein VYE73_10760 [Acidobacteriota bacterium]|nr:hypothetical protein [Acidobacteriota bacterium]
MKAFRRGNKLKIVSRDERVWNLIESLKLDRILDCHRSEEAALADFVQ